MTTPETPDSIPPARLTRRLGLGIALAVVVGNVIGSGIYLKPGTIARDGGSLGLIMFVWAFGGLLCILGGLCFAELGTMYPHAGGLYVYLKEAYGRLVAFLFGWIEFLFARPASIGALAVAFTGELPLGENPSDWLVVAVGSGVILAMAAVNIIGVLWGGRVQLVTTVLKVGSLLFIIGVPLAIGGFGESGVSLANYATTSPPSDPNLGVRLGAVLLAVMWAYNGWHGITPLAEEVRNPQRNIPLALFGGIGILIVLYLCTNLAYHSVLTMDQMAGAKQKAADLMMHTLMGSTGTTLIAVIIMCSTFGAINTNLLQSPRVTFAMGRDGAFFRIFGRVHAQFGTPAPAILLTALMAIALMTAAATAKTVVLKRDAAARAAAAQMQADDSPTSPDADSAASVPNPETLSGKVVDSLRDSSIFTLLTNFVIFSASVFYVLGVAAVIVLRQTRPDVERPYRTWGYPFVPLAFVGVYCWFLWRVYLDNPLEARTGLCFIALGVPVFLAFRWSARRADGARKS